MDGHPPGARQPSQEDDHMPKRTCSVEGCERPGHAKGYCRTHYTRWSKTGDPGPAYITPKRVGATCSFPGCGRKHGCHGLCNMHYKRKKRGLPLTNTPIRKTYGMDIGQRLNAMSKDDGECRIWTAALYPSGYGLISYNGRNRLAHRVVFELEIGEIPSGMQIDHICGRRKCIKASHLRLATPQQNAAYKLNRSKNSTGFRGVQHLPSGNWLATVRCHNMTAYRGVFNSRYEAAIEAAAARLRLFDFKEPSDVALAAMTPEQLRADTLETAMTRSNQ